MNLFNPKFIEADTSILFFNVMKSLKNWYEVSLDSKESSKLLPIMTSCRKIMEHLNLLDIELHRHLSLLEIEPQLFGM